MSIALEWTEMCVPGWFIEAVQSGAHLVYLMSTGRFRDAFGFAIGHEVAKDDFEGPRVPLAPYQTVLFATVSCPNRSS